MIKYLLALLTFCSIAWGHDHVPGDETHIPEYETNARVFVKKDKVTGMAEARGRWQDAKQSFRYRALTLGPYVRLFKNLRVGGFYRAQAGARHDADWISENGKWKWRNTNNRTEHLAIGDVTPRVMLDFLPGKRWVFELKNRYEYNFFNDLQTFSTRPGLTYFWFRGGEPFVNFFLQYEVWLPLNWSDHTVWETWVYGGFLFHVNDWLKMGLFGAWRETQWSATPSFKQKFAAGYEGTGAENSLFIGFNLLFRFVL